MSRPQPSFAIQVEVTNPGQFFACCGVLELAHRLWPRDEVCAWFDDGTFAVSVPGQGAEALQSVMALLRETNIRADETRPERALRPVHIETARIWLDWWTDGQGGRSDLKLWAGQQTSLGILETLRGALPTHADANLLNVARPLTGRFGVDPRAAWNALDVGFSPNSQQMEVATYPVAELLAAVGLQRFRPVRDEETKPGRFRYSTWSTPLPACVAGAASAGLLTAGGTKSYRFLIAERGSYKGFDYAITVGDST